MADQYNSYDDDDDDATQQLPSDFRKRLKKLEKALAEKDNELSALRASNRDRAVKDALESAGVNPKIAAFIPKDLASDQIAGWLNEYGELFGAATQQAATEQPDPMAEEQRRMDDSAATGFNPTGDEDLANRIKNAASLEELDQIVFGTSRGR